VLQGIVSLNPSTTNLCVTIPSFLFVKTVVSFATTSIISFVVKLVVAVLVVAVVVVAVVAVVRAMTVAFACRIFG
jgi:hypothetical protein